MSNAAILGSFAWQVASSLAAPTPNTTAITNPIAELGWKKEPRGRGTFSIILTSVLTLGLCVWTAIHPNIKPGASVWQKVKYRLLFVVLGMVAPEAVLAVAFYEWREARKFHRRWCNLYDIEPGSEQDTLRLKGAFFVTMGGVSMAPSYRVPSGISNILSPNAYLTLARTNIRAEVLEYPEFKKLLAQVATLTAARGEAMTEGADDEVHGPLDPELSGPQQEPRGSIASVVSEHERPASAENKEQEEKEMIIKREFVHYRDVQDKGKAEMLGKTLVCVQALWMLVQCVVRKASGLPVTLLEIHVAMHVVCAIMMYAFWFNKPQDVGEPLSIGSSIDPEQLSVELVRDDYNYKELSVIVVFKVPEQNSLINEYSTPVNYLPTIKSVRFPGELRERLARLRVKLGLRPRGRTRTPAIHVSPTHLVVPHGEILEIGPVRIENQMAPIRNCVMPPPELEFFKRAAKAYEAGKRPKLPSVELSGYISISNAGEILLNEIYVSNMLPAILILLVYGACHAAAWNTHFPTPVECMLWRTSSVVIATIPAYALFLSALYNSGHTILINVFTLWIIELKSILKDIEIPLTAGNDLGRVLYITYCTFWSIILIALVVVVMMGRSYLFIESFLSLRSLPSGSFNSTPWEDYFPHF